MSTKGKSKGGNNSPVPQNIQSANNPGSNSNPLNQSNLNNSNEIKSACNYLASLPRQGALTAEQRKSFSDALADLLIQKYQNHWYLDNPLRGNGYRSIIILDHFIDPMIMEAASRANIGNISELMPTELYLWIDPFEVSYKSNEFAPIPIIYKGFGKTATTDEGYYGGNLFYHQFPLCFSLC